VLRADRGRGHGDTVRAPGVARLSWRVGTVVYARHRMKPVFETALGRLHHADAVAWLRTLGDGCADLVVADPPYGGNAVHWDRFGSLDDYVAWCETWIAECARVLAPHGSLFVCGWSENLAYLKVVGDRHLPHCRWLVWHYRNKHAPWRTDWGRAHESVLHFRRSKRFRFNQDAVREPYNQHTLRYPDHAQGATSALGDGRPHRWRPHPGGAKPKDVFELSVLNNGMEERTAHPTQKPEELVRRLVLACSDKGDLVLDPFGGSGTTFVVAEKLERRWEGTELEEEYLGYAIERLGSVSPDEEGHLRDYEARARASARNRSAVRDGRAQSLGGRDPA
jgi:site-specific DNA-methyltransferase (adenine-specific)